MNILHNPLAEMYGPEFLLIYGAVIAITLGVCWLMVSVADKTKSLPLPLIPANPNPYEIAYLQGEERRVTNLVIFNLIQRRFLQLNEANIERSPNYSNIEQLSPLEQEVFDWFSEPRVVTEISRQLYFQVQPYCEGYEHILQEQQLLYLSDWRQVVQQACLIGETIIFILGGYKFIAALTNGHHNVAFLVIMTVFAFIMLKFICYLPPRLSCLGQKYLQQLQDVFEQLKLKQKFKNGVPSFTDIQEHLSIDEYDLLVALFGVHERADTPNNSYGQMFTNATFSFFSSSGGSCSGGCGGGDGGGGCGGGGCGGCGGGGD